MWPSSVTITITITFQKVINCNGLQLQITTSLMCMYTLCVSVLNINTPTYLITPIISVAVL